jgi:hypothetical protein
MVLTGSLRRDRPDESSKQHRYKRQKGTFQDGLHWFLLRGGNSFTKLGLCQCVVTTLGFLSA